jgi:hypothetical protein
MTTLQLVIAHGVKIGVLAALVGAFVRGHSRRCWTFVVYLGVIVCCNALVTTWPATFFTPTFWILKQAVYDILKLAIAVELCIRVVQAFPGAARGARVLAVLGLLLGLGFILTGVGHQSYATTFEWQPQIAAAAIWLFALNALLIAWYHLPLDDWHRSIIMGFAAYLLVCVALLNVLKHHGWRIADSAGLADSLAYLALVCWWAWTSWQPARVPAVTPEQLEVLGAPAPRRA